MNLFRRFITSSRRGRLWRIQGGIDKDPRCAYPVGIAPVNEFVCAACKAALGRVLACTKPGDQTGDVEISVSRDISKRNWLLGYLCNNEELDLKRVIMRRGG